MTQKHTEKTRKTPEINPESTRKLSMIIVNWNTVNLLKDCVDSIINDQWLMANGEIIIVDNNSKDGSKKYLKRLARSNELKLDIIPMSPRDEIKKEEISAKRISSERSEPISNITVIFNNSNEGFAKANNQGMEIAQSEYIMLLNSDTIVPKGALEKLVGYLDSHPEVAAVSPKLLNKDKSTQIEYYMKFPNLWQILFYHNYPSRLVSMRTPLKRLFTSGSKNDPFQVDQLPGAALMTRREVVDQMGKLDDKFIFFFEDVDWCFRIKKKTAKELIVFPKAEIIHYGGASWKKWLEKDRFKFYRQYYLSLLKFVDKNYQVPLFPYQLSLSCSFLINLFCHLLTFAWNKSFVQLKLIKTIWKKKYDFELPR